MSRGRAGGLLSVIGDIHLLYFAPGFAALGCGVPGMAYILSTSNCIFNGMPPESYRIMLDEYHRLSESAAAAEGA